MNFNFYSAITTAEQRSTKIFKSSTIVVIPRSKNLIHSVDSRIKPLNPGHVKFSPLRRPAQKLKSQALRDFSFPQNLPLPHPLQGQLQQAPNLPHLEVEDASFFPILIRGSQEQKKLKEIGVCPRIHFGDPPSVNTDLKLTKIYLLFIISPRYITHPKLHLHQDLAHRVDRRHQFLLHDGAVQDDGLHLVHVLLVLKKFLK